jgi:glycosyltransferase involved in cell wall biosynthesis
MRVRTELGLPTDRPVLLFVGRFINRKGLPLLQEMARTNPLHEWVFVGRGPIRPADWGLANVRCPGSVPHRRLADYYRAADLLVLPSVVEGFPLVVQEAMACGTPVLVTREIVEGCPMVGEVACICEPSKELFCLEIREMVSSLILDKKRIPVAVFAKKHWDLERCADQYLNLFVEVLSAITARS